MKNFAIKEYKGRKLYVTTQDQERFFIGEDEINGIQLKQNITRGEATFPVNVIGLNNSGISFIYMPQPRENSEFLSFYVVADKHFGFQEVFRYSYYYEGGFPKLLGSYDYTVCEEGEELSDIFINRHCFINRPDLSEKCQGEIIGQVSGLLARRHKVIRREYDIEAAKDNFGGQNNGKNLLYIEDEFKLGEIGISEPLDRISYWVNADNMEVVGPIHSEKNGDINVEHGWIEEMGEYPTWAKRIGFENSDLDATVVYAILEPIVNRILNAAGLESDKGKRHNITKGN